MKIKIMNTNLHQIQQGDVLLLAVDKLPKGCKKVKKDPRGIVLAEGETTGHYHAIEDDGSVALMESPNGLRFLVKNGADTKELKHQEHGTTRISQTIHQVGQVREKDWFKDMIRPVRD